MSAYQRNIMVALTVIVALVLLGWMMLRFGTAPVEWFAEGQMPIIFETRSAEGITEGAPVQYRGMDVGHVTTVRRSKDNKTILIDAGVDKSPPLPGNVEGVIRSPLLGGTSRIDLVLVGPSSSATSPRTRPAAPPGSSPAQVQPVGQLQPNQRIPARYAGPELLPAEFTELAYDLRDTSRELRRLMVRVDEEQIIPKLATTIDELNKDIVKAGRTLDSLNSIISDEKLRADLVATTQNLRTTSETATRIASNLETLSKNANSKVEEIGGNTNKLVVSAQAKLDQMSKSIDERLLQMANVLNSFEKASKKLNEGDGTAAKLLNDPRLYANLLDASKELSLMMADFRRLIEQWEQEGVYFNLSGKKK